MRIFTSANDPLDFCSRHAPSLDTATKRYGNVGDGPDGRGNCFEYDADHPDYDDDEYRCKSCRCKLSMFLDGFGFWN
jgi:hypothetical protein